MNLLVTAGGTIVPIDRVRCIANTATGRTGAAIALAAHRRGHRVHLLTSHPDAAGAAGPSGERWTVETYRTFEELHAALATAVRSGNLDAVVLSAAVSDYTADGIYAAGPGTHWQEANGMWRTGGPATMVDRSAGKVKSNEKELWLRLVRTPKLIDLIRSEWKFDGILVKFKLEVDLNDADLVSVAERSRTQSQADLMVANTLEGAARWAYLGPIYGEYLRIERTVLADRLLDAVERCQRERAHG